MKSILSLLLVFLILSDSAQAESNLNKHVGSEIDEERHLNNNNYNNNNYRQWMQYYNKNGANGGGYYMKNANRGYYGGGYYGRRYYKNQRYYGDEENQNDEMNNQDDGQAEANEEEEYNDDGEIDYGNSGSTSFIPSEIEEEFWRWYESPPSQWTSAEWAWFSGILVVTVGLMFCCCLGCANLCMEGQERACSPEKQQQNFDDYTSLESGKRGSFMTLHTKESASTTGDTVDDEATYDSIMRMRST